MIDSANIKNIFGTQLQSEIICQSCKASSKVHENALDVSLALSNNVHSLESAFEGFTKTEILSHSNKYNCEKCKKLVVANKKMTVSSCPAVLTIQLKRFDFSKSLKGTKISNHIAFDEAFDLGPFLSKKTKGVWYDLYGVLVVTFFDLL